MNLQVNYDLVQNAEMKSGDYEVIVSDYKGKQASPSGWEYYEIVLTVRNDINQPYQNACIFQKWGAEFIENPNNAWAWCTPAKNLGIPNGQNFNSYDELFSAWVGRPAKVRVEVSKREHNGKEYEDRNVKRWMPTNYPHVTHVQKQKEQPQPQMQQQAPQQQVQYQQPQMNGFAGAMQQTGANSNELPF